MIQYHNDSIFWCSNSLEYIFLERGEGSLVPRPPPSFSPLAVHATENGKGHGTRLGGSGQDNVEPKDWAATSWTQ